MASLAENHPYYVQQLAQQAWLRSGKVCHESNVHEAHESLVLQLSLLFQSITDGLATTQVNFLNALVDGVEQLSSAETLRNYRLGTSANVLRIRNALVEKEIIDTMGERIEFLDPMYAHWLRVHYFRKNSTR